MVILTILNMLSVYPAYLVLRLLFSKNPKALRRLASPTLKSTEVIKAVCGFVLLFSYLIGLLGLTMTVNFNLETSVSNKICLATIYSFINELTVSEVLRALIQMGMIKALRSDAMKKKKRLRWLLTLLANPHVMKLFK